MIVIALLLASFASTPQECGNKNWLTDREIRQTIIGRTVIHEDFADQVPYKAIREERFSGYSPTRRVDKGALAYTYLSMNRSGGGEYTIQNGSLCIRSSGNGVVRCRRVSLSSDELILEYTDDTGRVCPRARLSEK